MHDTCVDIYIYIEIPTKNDLFGPQALLTRRLPVAHLYPRGPMKPCVNSNKNCFLAEFLMVVYQQLKH